MKSEQNLKNSGLSAWYLKPVILLVLSSVLIIGQGLRWNISIFTWVFLVPVLLYYRLGYNRVILFIVLLFSFILEVLKIASEPMYAFIALGSGIQTTLLMSFALWITAIVRHSKGEFFGIVTFAATIAVSEFLASKMVLGTWGMLANTQIDNLPLMQMASITGAVGISFLIAWFNALTESVLYAPLAKKSTEKYIIRQAITFMVLLTLAYTYGAFRLERQQPGPTIQVAGISTKKYSIRDVLSGDLARIKNNEEVFDLVKKAAEKKSRLIVTNEGGLVLLPDEEASMISEAQKMAKQYEADIVLGYLILIRETPKVSGELFFNKLVWIDSEGKILTSYHKQFPPPGEPSRKVSQEILPVQTFFGMAGTAICYDFDSPKITATHGKNGVGLVILPSSDWKGIDPFHTQMAGLRAIEQGYSVVRSARASTSMVFDAHGRVRASSPWFENNDGIMIASVPTQPVATLYKSYGDWFAYANIVFLIIITGPLFYRKRL